MIQKFSVQRALLPLVCVAAVLFVIPIGAVENSTTTQKAVPLQNATTNASEVATPKTQPKIDILGSDLCKKCICDKNISTINCSQKLGGVWFNDDEWNTLQNGDVNFTTFILEHNNLTTVPVFRSYPVRSLFLAHNQIATIELKAFQNLTDLEKLDLSHNRLTSKTMGPHIFWGQYVANEYQPLHRMRELDLGYNEMHRLDSDAFEHLPNLETLILCMNTFQVIDHGTATAISDLMELKTLDMSYMEIKELPPNFLHGPRKLETLILSGNLFEDIPDDLELAINLRELVLDENPIGDLTGEEIFPKIINLRYLSISYMPELKLIDAGALSNLQNLTVLVASNNPKLSHISPYALKKNTTDPKIFDYPSIEKMYLHNNNLTVLSGDLLERWDRVAVIDLRFNPWACDCQNDWLVNILVEHIKTTLPQSLGNVKCASPPERKAMQLNTLAESKALKCNDRSDWSEGAIILIVLIIGILIGIPMTFGAIFAYRSRCFGFCKNRKNYTAEYNRASFSEEMS